MKGEGNIMKKLAVSFFLVPVLLVSLAFSASAETKQTTPSTATTNGGIVLDWLDPGW